MIGCMPSEMAWLEVSLMTVLVTWRVRVTKEAAEMRGPQSAPRAETFPIPPSGCVWAVSWRWFQRVCGGLSGMACMEAEFDSA